MVVWEGGCAEASKKGWWIEAKQCSLPESDMPQVMEL